MDHPVLVLSGILTALALGAISPGPSFLFVMRTSVALSRRDGFAAAAGMGIGAAFISTLALVGVRALIAQVGWLYIAFKLVGGAYLVFLAWRLWRGAAAPSAPAAEIETPRPARGLARSFFLALATQLSNPKTVVVIGGIFAALLPAHVPFWMYLVIPPIHLTIETSWYCFVAITLSSPRPRAIYLKARSGIDRAAGGLLGVLGARLIIESAREAY
jgi:threonine/homoserine/homoserine lactone efflux protein